MPRKKGNRISSNWTVREYKGRNGKRRKFKVRKINGKVQKRVIKDLRRSPQIPLAAARKFHRNRSRHARKADEAITSTKLKQYPDKAWRNNPRICDVKSIDDKK